MPQRRHLCLAALILSALLLVGCAPKAPLEGQVPVGGTPLPTPSLEGSEWVLIAIRGQPPEAGTAPTLAFYAGNYLEANSGCNTLGADYATQGHALTLARIHRTEGACTDPDLAAQDVAFFDAWEQIAAYDATEDTLVLRDVDGAPLLEYARRRAPTVDPALVDTEWLLVELHGEPPLEGSRITLDLRRESLGGLAGCNHYGGEYEVASEGALRLGETAITAMLCLEPEGVMDQERAYTEALRAVTGYRLQDERLVLVDAGGEAILAYERQPVYESDSAALVGTAWRLAQMDGEPVAAEAPLTLIFYREGSLGGFAGCRDYVASYRVDGDDLTLPTMAMLDPGCDLTESGLAQESFREILLDKIAVEREGELLTLHGERGGTLVLERMPEDAGLPLEGTAWSLLGFLGPNPNVPQDEGLLHADGLLPGTAIDLVLSEGAASGSAGCNRYTGSYSLQGTTLTLRALAATEMACAEPPRLMLQESRYLETLQVVTIARVYGDRLWLETADGRVLLFAAARSS